jgi:hypothetical protein
MTVRLCRDVNRLQQAARWPPVPSGRLRVDPQSLLGGVIELAYQGSWISLMGCSGTRLRMLVWTGHKVNPESLYLSLSKVFSAATPRTRVPRPQRLLGGERQTAVLEIDGQLGARWFETASAISRVVSANLLVLMRLRRPSPFGTMASNSLVTRRWTRRSGAKHTVVGRGSAAAAWPRLRSALAASSDRSSLWNGEARQSPMPIPQPCCVVARMSTGANASLGDSAIEGRRTGDPKGA